MKELGQWITNFFLLIAVFLTTGANAAGSKLKDIWKN